MAGFYLLRWVGKQHLDSEVSGKGTGMSRAIRCCCSLRAIDVGKLRHVLPTRRMNLLQMPDEYEQNTYSIYTEPFLAYFLL